MTHKIDPTFASLVNSYRNLAQLWRTRADTAMDQHDAFGTYEAVKKAQECEQAARRIELRHIMP